MKTSSIFWVHLMVGFATAAAVSFLFAIGARLLDKPAEPNLLLGGIFYTCFAGSAIGFAVTNHSK